MTSNISRLPIRAGARPESGSLRTRGARRGGGDRSPNSAERGRPRRPLPEEKPSTPFAKRSSSASSVPRRARLRRGLPHFRAGRRRRATSSGAPCAIHGDDLRDAPGEDRLPGAPQRRQPLAGEPAAPDRRTAVADGLLDHRRQRRRQHPLERGGDPDEGRASPSSATPRSSPMARMPMVVVTTARRAEAAASSDQVLVAFLNEDYTLEPTAIPGTRSVHARHLQHRLHPARTGRGGPGAARAL